MGNGVAEGENGVRSGMVVIVTTTVGVGEAGAEPGDVEDGAGSKVGTETSTLLAGAADSSSWHPATKLTKRKEPASTRTNKNIESISPD